MNDSSIARNAPDDSLLGQLQRGRGRGFLRALQEDKVVVRQFLLDCVTHDPRLDRQFESRSDYYAQLILLISLPLDPFEAYLRATSKHNQHDVNDLVLGTVCALAARGEASAIAISRSYLTYGPEWGIVYATLMGATPNTLSAEEMSRILDQRFPGDDTLGEELASHYHEPEPWRLLRLANLRVDRILREDETHQPKRQQQRTQLHTRFANLSTADLLAAAVDVDTERVAIEVIDKRVTAADLDLLLQGLQQGNRWQRFVALSGLRCLADPASLPLLLAFFESPDSQPGTVHERRLRGAASRAIIALPPENTLKLARTWLEAPPNASHYRLALLILEAHATLADVGRIQAALLPWRSSTAGTRDDYEYSLQYSILQILGRFPEQGPYPEVETVFQETNYARTRFYAAQVLMASDGEGFAHNLALECLWDCEEDLRRLGCESVSLDLAATHARLQELSDDPYEAEEVRKVAQARLLAR